MVLLELKNTISGKNSLDNSITQGRQIFKNCTEPQELWENNKMLDI